MAFKYIGTSSTTITDGGVENPTINGAVVTTKNEGDIVFYTDKRFLWTSNAWKYQGDINTHTDVQDALNAIAEAYKGEEVRGSIYDAIALIDTRSSAMEDIVGQNVEPIVEDVIDDYIDVTDLVYTIDNGTITCNKTYAEIMEILSGSKRLVFYVSPSFASAVYLCIGTIVPAYSSVEYLDVKLYYIDYDYGNVLHYCSITHFADRIRLNGDTATSIQAKLTAGANITIDPITNTISATGGGGGSYTAGDGIDITNNVISIGEPVYITMTEGANGIADTSFIVSITEANFLAKFGIGAKDLMAILSGSYNVAKLGIKVLDDTSTSMDAYLDKIPILDIRYSKYDEELSLSEAATMIFIWDHCIYEFVINVEYSDEFRGTVSKINGHIAKTKVTSNGYGITGSGNSISVDTSVIQKKLTSTNAGTGISITNDGQGNPVISSTGGGGGSYTAGEGIDIDSNNAISLKITDKAEGGSVVSFSNAGENLPLKSCIVSIEPVQSGSGEPSPSNVRTITGWTECNITVCGNNLLDPNAIIKGRIDNGVIGYQDGTSVLTLTETGVSFTTVANYRGVLTDLIKVKKGSKYYIKYTTADDSLLSKSLYIYDDGGNYIQNVAFSNLYTIPNNVGYIRVGIQLILAGSVELTNMYIKEESSGDLFETYKGNTYNIEFPSQAGTVYGGTLDATNGVLIVDKIMRTFTGGNDETWGVNATGGYYTFNIANLTENKVSQVPICNRFKGVEPTPYSYLNNGEVALTTSPHNYLNFLTDVATDVASWKTWLASNNIQIVLELATPITYNLTPTEIKTLLGINKIFADCGDIETPVTYYTEAGEDILYLALHGIPAAEGSEF